MASNKLEVSEFDFDDIKTNLKTFLQSQSEFQDYDFEGSGFAVLIDLLAYNTHYLGFNANMLANEMYLDSADIRKNVVSLAKMLGYTPTSAKSPVANVDILVNNASGSTITDGLVAVYQRCVHLGCRVPWCNSSQGFECPCHGSKYNMVGEYFAGPAPRNLDRFNVANVSGRLIIDTGTIIESPRAPGMSVKYPQGLSCIALTTEE